MCHGVPQRIAQELYCFYSGRKMLMTGMCFCALRAVAWGKQGHFPLTSLLYLHGIQPGQKYAKGIIPTCVFCRVAFVQLWVLLIYTLMRPCVLAVMPEGLTTTSYDMFQGVFNYLVSLQGKGEGE